MMKTETIWLQRPASDVPWGFRLRGGRDYPYPLTVQRVSPGSIAATGLAVGDVILQIADIDTCNLSFAQSQDLIKDCNNLLQFHIAKGGGKASSVPASPQPRQEQPSLQPQQPQQPQQQVASPTAAMASGVHDLFRDMYRNSEHLGTTPDPRYSPVSGAASPGQSAAYSSNMQPQQKYGNDMYSSGPRPIDIQHLGSGSRDSPRQISVQQYGRDNNSGGPRQIQIQHLGRESDQSDARYTPVQQYSNGSDSGARRINIQHIGSGGDHGSRVVPINTSPAAIDNNVYQPAQPEPPSYQNLDSQAIRVQSPIVPKTSFSASPQYPYQGSTQPEPSYPYQPAAPNSTYDAVGPYKPVSSQSSTSYGPPKSYSSDAGQAFNSSYGPQTSAPSLQPKLQRQNISSGSGGMPSSPSIGGRRTPSYAGASYGQSPSRAQAPSPGFGNVQSPTYGGVQSPTYGGVQSPRYGNTQTSTLSQQMSNPGGVQSPTYGGVQSPTYGSQTSNPVQSPTYGGVQSPTYGSQTSNPVLSPTYGSVQSPTYDSQSSNPVQSPSYGSVQSPTYGGVQSPRVYGSSREPSYGQSGPGMSSPVQNQSSQNAGTPYSPSTNTTPRPFGVQSHASDNQSVSSPSAYGPKSPSSYDPYSPRTPQGFKSVQPNLGSPSTTAPAPPFSQPYSPSTGPTSPGRSPMAPSVNSPGTPMGQTQGPQFNQYTPTSPGTQPPSMGQSSQYAPGTSPSLNQTNLQNNQYDSNPPGAPDIYSLQQPPQSYGTDNGSSPGGPPPAPPVPSVPSPKPVSPTPPKPRPSSRNDNLQRPSSQTEHRIPDAVLNMAARGPPEKKPFTYAPSADIIKEQRDKVRRKPGSAALPRYQNLLNMPSFDDSTPTVQKVPQSPTAQAVNQAELPRDGMVAHAQYNSPLNVYSDNAVGETFAAQTGGAVNVTPQRQGSKPGDQDVTQSPTYRMLHGMDPGKGPGNRVLPQGMAPSQESMENVAFGVTNKPHTRQGLSFMILQCLYESDEPDQDTPVSQSNGSQQECTPRQKSPTSEDENHSGRKTSASHDGAVIAPPKVVRTPSKDDELKFSGTLRQSDIPSKSFQRLQQFTGSDGSPYREPEPEEDVGNYDEASIRYRGGHIPSKSFKILQNMTGGSELPPRPTSRNKSRERELDGPDYPAPQHGADMSYGGAHIPSKSFRYLQQSIGDAWHDGDPRSVHPVPRKCPPQPRISAPGVTDF